MPGQRIRTAFVLLALLLLALFAPGRWPMQAFLILMCATACWEWLRLLPCPERPARGVAVAFALLLIALSVLRNEPRVNEVLQHLLIPLACAFWLIVAPAWVRRAQVPASWPGAAIGLAALWTLAAVWWSLTWLFDTHGPATFISLWALVWCADVGAYAVGRRWGRHRLAPRVSPGKTWEGAAAGVLAALLWTGLTARLWPDSYGAVLQSQMGAWAPWLAGAGLAVWSIVGDLFESLLKRRADVKDSSALLPGHGGVYDRIDALLPVAPAAVLLLLAGSLHAYS